MAAVFCVNSKKSPEGFLEANIIDACIHNIYFMKLKSSIPKCHG